MNKLDKLLAQKKIHFFALVALVLATPPDFNVSWVQLILQIVAFGYLFFIHGYGFLRSRRLLNAP